MKVKEVGLGDKACWGICFVFCRVVWKGELGVVDGLGFWVFRMVEEIDRVFWGEF